MPSVRGVEFSANQSELVKDLIRERLKVAVNLYIRATRRMPMHAVHRVVGIRRAAHTSSKVHCL